MSDFSPRWAAASNTERRVAAALNYYLPKPVLFSRATHADQDALLAKGQEFINELQARGLFILDPGSKEFADRAASTVRRLLGYEEP